MQEHFVSCFVTQPQEEHSWEHLSQHRSGDEAMRQAWVLVGSRDQTLKPIPKAI